MKKCLIIRFSSFGDIVQLMGAAGALGHHGYEVHWATKREFAPLVSLCPDIHRVWGLDGARGLRELIRFALALRKECFSHIYDAHANFRSFICNVILKFPYIQGPHFARRSKERWKRFLLFKLRINKFPRPYRGAISYHRPLEQWGITKKGLPRLSFERILSETRRKELNRWKDKILLAPSAAWEMKRWPVENWIKLVTLWREEQFVLLGGREDGFCEDIRKIIPHRCINLAGKLSLVESCYLVSKAPLLISADTGLVHMADFLRAKALVLMGPTAFGFPSGPSVRVVEVPLSCRPCSKDGRGRCSQKVYKKCMVDISPNRVFEEAKSWS